jgi:hypothetical protein
VERLGTGLEKPVLEAGVAALAAAARSSGRVLRLGAEVFSRDPAERAAADAVLAACGFAPEPDRRRYARTLAADLTPSEDDILASFQKKVRRDIRDVAKHPVAILPVSDPALSGRMNELLRETMGRTGGEYRPVDWPAWIDFSRCHPSLSRIVGLFRTDAAAPNGLLAFAWSCHHCTYAHYDTAASTRKTELKIPLMYGLLWDLMRWAKQNGAAWFDFGGVTLGHTHDASDPLGGISDFKRYFSKELLEVGGEWVLRPSPLRAEAARWVNHLAEWVRRRRAGGGGTRAATVSQPDASAPFRNPSPAPGPPAATPANAEVR